MALVLVLANTPLGAQVNAEGGYPVYISGSAGITNNGISLIPSFSLEQPAAIFNLNLQKGRFSFEPEFTFSLEEWRPWYQIYWLRYKLVEDSKFKLRAGGHLSLNFVKQLDANMEEQIKAERYLVGELVPSYDITENISVGIYYLQAHGFDVGTSRPTHFLTFNATFSNIAISETLRMEISPQVFYLSLYGVEGYYATSGIKITKQDFPLSLSSTVSQVLSTKIEGGKDLLWNLVLTYNFKKSRIGR